MLSTTFLFSKTFLLSQFSPPSAAHAFNYNIPFIKNITFITISPPSAAHNIADTHLPLCDPTWLPFIKIFRPPLQPMLSTTTFLLSKTFLLSQFSPPLCSPQHSRHTFAFVRPYLTSFYQNFTPPLQPMLSTTFLLSKTFLLSQSSPPSAAHAFNDNIPFIKNITFITIFPPLCSPQHSRHTFAFVRPYLTSFYQNFLPPLQPMLSTTTFLLSKTFLLSQFSPPLCSPQHSRHTFAFVRPYLTFFYQNFTPPSAAHAFNYIPFIKNIPFITIFPPLCSPCFQLQHSFYQKHSFYHNLPPPLQPMLSTTTFLLSKTLLLSQFSPPSTAHNIADTHLPLCDPTWLPFIKIFPPLCNSCFQLQHSFYQKHSFYHNFPPPLQPTTLPTHICLCATLPDFLLSKFSPPSATHAFNYNIPFIKNIPFITIFRPLCSPQHSRHTFAFVRPYLTFFYQNFTPPLQAIAPATQSHCESLATLPNKHV